MEHDEMNTWLGKRGGSGFLADSFARILPKGVHCASVFTQTGCTFMFYVEQTTPEIAPRLEGGRQPKVVLDAAAPGLGTTNIPLVIQIENWFVVAELEKKMEPRLVLGRFLQPYV